MLSDYLQLLYWEDSLTFITEILLDKAYSFKEERAVWALVLTALEKHFDDLVYIVRHL